MNLPQQISRGLQQNEGLRKVRSELLVVYSRFRNGASVLDPRELRR